MLGQAFFGRPLHDRLACLVVQETPRPKLVTKLQERKELHLQRSRIVRALYVMVGFTVLLAGLAMLVLPGPAFLVIPIGLAILALEFTWAETMLERAIEQGEKAKQRATDTTTTQRVLTGVAVGLGAAAVAIWAALGDIPVAPV
jgi:uncharacterized protein (TIGR02611 family)